MENGTNFQANRNTNSKSRSNVNRCIDRPWFLLPGLIQDSLGMQFEMKSIPYGGSYRIKSNASNAFWYSTLNDVQGEHGIGAQGCFKQITEQASILLLVWGVEEQKGAWKVKWTFVQMCHRFYNLSKVWGTALLACPELYFGQNGIL